MRTIILAGLIACCMTTLAQTNVEKTFALANARKVELSFDFPELIKVKSWNKKEVLVKASVSINGGDNNDAYQITSSVSGDRLIIHSEVNNLDKIPRHITIRKGDQDFHFPTSDKNDPRVVKFLQENGNTYSYISNGVDIKITVELFVPADVQTKVFSKFGLVEVSDCRAPLEIEAPHGGVDATISPSITGDLIAITQFGEILTNLETKFSSTGDNDDHPGNWTEVAADLGNGHRYELKSQFGKIYLRKP